MRYLLMALAMTLPGAAIAETPLFSVSFGDDTLRANAGDITVAESRLDYSNRPALLITLDPRFDPMMAELTLGHIGEVGALLICGELVSEPTLTNEISKAELLVTGIDPDEVIRLAALLQNGTCEPAPES
jgi:preprotein translocase subunit SecD